MRTRICKGLVSLSMIFLTAEASATFAGNLTVSGGVSPARCEVLVPNNGVYDLGLINTLDSTLGPKALPPVTRTWRIRCDNPTTLAVIPEDNRATSAGSIGNTHFGIGGDGEASLGYFELGISRARTDQRAVMLKTAERPASGGGITPLLPDKRSQWVTEDNIVQAGKVFDVDITVYPWINPRTRMVMDQVKFDGSVTLNFIFGL